METAAELNEVCPATEILKADSVITEKLIKEVRMGNAKVFKDGKARAILREIQKQIRDANNILRS